MITGILFIKYAVHWQMASVQACETLSCAASREGAISIVDALGPEKSFGEDLPLRRIPQQEVDPILDKISAQGIQSLTDRERRILQAAREKMAKR